MKYLILSLMVFTSFQAFSKDCTRKNYTDFTKNKNATDKLIRLTGEGCNLYDSEKPWIARGYNFRSADFRKANLSGSVFNGAVFRRANLSEANLRNVSFNGADLSWVNFAGADLSWSDVKGADLIGANFNNKSNIKRTDFSGSLFPAEHRNKLTKKQQRTIDKFIYRNGDIQKKQVREVL